MNVDSVELIVLIYRNENDKTTSGRKLGHADGMAAARQKVSYSQGISPLFGHYRYCKFMLHL